MKKILTSLALICFSSVFLANSQTENANIEDGSPSPQHSEGVLEHFWQMHLTLSEDKRARLSNRFESALIASRDARLQDEWQARLGPRPWQSDAFLGNPFQEQMYQELNRRGKAGFIQAARAGSAPFRLARADLISAAGEITRDDAFASALIALLIELAAETDSNNPFSGEIYVVSALRLSMIHCDAPQFESAAQMLERDLSPLEHFWRARITGKLAPAMAALDAAQRGDNSTPIRQALEGYEDILIRDYCTIV